MKKPIISEISWLFKKERGKLIVVGFLRDHKDDCFIIGGATGSHYSGHAETWQDKWNKYIEQGYITQDVAIKNGIIKDAWRPPSIKQEDKNTISRIQNNIL